MFWTIVVILLIWWLVGLMGAHAPGSRYLCAAVIAIIALKARLAQAGRLLQWPKA